jgi:hypothetical protein
MARKISPSSLVTSDDDRSSSRGVMIPGLWESIRQEHVIRLKDAEEPDPQWADEPLYNGPWVDDLISEKRAALASMDRGEPQSIAPPHSRDFPAVARVDWLNGSGRCRCVRVYPDDWVAEYLPHPAARS